MKWLGTRRSVLLLILAVSCEASAAPGIVYRYSAPPKTEVVGVSAIVNLEEPFTERLSGCEQRIADLVIDEVVYEGASETVVGFRAKKPAPNEWYGLFRMNTKALYAQLANAERRNVQLLVRKGERVVITYQVCGSGGFASVRDVFSRSAVNNP